MLTDTKILNAKHLDPKHDNKPYKLSDSEGLYLLVSPTAKLWRLAYRFNKLQKSLSFGAYPAISLKDAREKRDAAKALLAKGIDPGVTKQEEKRTHEAVKTFGDWADAWLTKERTLWGNRTITSKERFIGYLKQEFGKRRLPDIKRADVLLFLKTFEATGTLETRDRVRSVGEEVFLYGDVEGNDYNPFRNLKKQLIAKESEPRPALIATDIVIDLFQNIAAPYQGSRYGDLVGYALRFISLTAVRPGEVANAEWSEIDFKTARWTIPAAKMKMRHEHVVPLSRQVLAILTAVREMTGARRYVFSCSQDKPISGDTLNGRLRRLGYDTAVQHCAHGFRTTFSTLCNGEVDRDENKLWDGDVIELQLAHLDESSVKAVYNRTGALSLIGARAKLLQHWADRIDTMVGNNVVKFTPELAAG